MTETLERVMTRCIVLALLFVAAEPAFGMDGIVIERETRQPIEGAIVIRVWRGVVPVIVQMSSVCYHVAMARSQRGGRFSLPDFSYTFTPQVLDRTSFIEAVYKPGYHLVTVENDSRVVVERHVSERTRRLAQVLSVRIPYECPDARVKELIEPVLRPRYEEARALVRTKDEWMQVEGLLNAIETMQFGQETASRNTVEREKSWRESIPSDEARSVRP